MARRRIVKARRPDGSSRKGPTPAAIITSCADLMTYSAPTTTSPPLTSPIPPPQPLLLMTDLVSSRVHSPNEGPPMLPIDPSSISSVLGSTSSTVSSGSYSSSFDKRPKRTATPKWYLDSIKELALYFLKKAIVEGVPITGSFILASAVEEKRRQMMSPPPTTLH